MDTGRFYGLVWVAIGLAVLGTAAAAERESWEVERRAQMHFLCEWRSNVPGGRSFSAPFCDDPDMPIGKALIAYDAWWGHVFEGRDLDAGNSYRQRFKEEWADSETLKQLRALESERIQARLKEEKDREEKLNKEAWPRWWPNESSESRQNEMRLANAQQQPNNAQERWRPTSHPRLAK